MFCLHVTSADNFRNIHFSHTSLLLFKLIFATTEQKNPLFRQPTSGWHILTIGVIAVSIAIVEFNSFKQSL